MCRPTSWPVFLSLFDSSRRLGRVHFRLLHGSPAVSGSVSARSASSTPGSTSSTRLRPPPGSRARSAGWSSSRESSSCLPRLTVPASMPKRSHTPRRRPTQSATTRAQRTIDGGARAVARRGVRRYHASLGCRANQVVSFGAPERNEPHWKCGARSPKRKGGLSSVVALAWFPYGVKGERSSNCCADPLSEPCATGTAC